MAFPKSKEKPTVQSLRVLNKHRRIISKWSKKMKLTKSAVNRVALEEFDHNHTNLELHAKALPVFVSLKK